MLNFIKDRFEKILSKKIAGPRPKRKNNKNTYVLRISNKNARIAFDHFYNIECICLSRKWNYLFKKHCEEFQKNRVLARINKKLNLYNTIFNFLKNKNSESLLEEIKMHSGQLKRMIESTDYKTYLKIYKELDAGVSDMESQEGE